MTGSVMNQGIDQTARAKHLRQNQTYAEAKLWREIRAKRFLGIKFKRQQPIGPYIVDFVSFDAMLVIEIDGSQHNTEKVETYDNERTNYLESLGYTVIRYWNTEIL